MWERREEQEVIDLLTPYMVGDGDTGNRLLFHNAVMRWKCSTLSEEELRTLQEWIEEEVEQRWDAVRYPWRNGKAAEVDDLTAENQYIQRSVLIPYGKALI